MINNQEINRLLREGISLHPGAQPLTIAAWVRASIRKDDREDALLILLENQLSKVYGYDRAPVPSRQPSHPRQPNRDPVQEDARLGRFAPMHQRVWARSRAKEIPEQEAREQLQAEDVEREKEIEQRTKDIIAAIAETNRKADIADALNRRVMVRQRWKMLLDCTLEEVEWLGKNATNMALGNLHVAAFYEDIANRMKESGAETVNQLLPVAA